jgi:hypothetical protein
MNCGEVLDSDTQIGDEHLATEVRVMSTKAVKAKRKNGRSAAKRSRTKAQEAADFEALLIRIVNDPDAPAIAKGLAALRLERNKSGEPYLTIEQIQAELGRD